MIYDLFLNIRKFKHRFKRFVNQIHPISLKPYNFILILGAIEDGAKETFK